MSVDSSTMTCHDLFSGVQLMEIQGQHVLSKCVVTDSHFVMTNSRGEVTWLSQITGHSVHQYQHLKSSSFPLLICSLPLCSLSSLGDTLITGDSHGFVTLFSSLSQQTLHHTSFTRRRILISKPLQKRHVCIH